MVDINMMKGDAALSNPVYMVGIIDVKDFEAKQGLPEVVMDGRWAA